MRECTPIGLDILTPAKCVPNPAATKIDWTKDRDEDSPYIEPTTCDYSIVVDRGLSNWGVPNSETYQKDAPGTQREQTLKDYFAYGVDKLLKFYRKDLSDSDYTRQQLIDSVITTGTRWFGMTVTPSRPMKVLVALPYDVFHDIPERPRVPPYVIDDMRIAKFDIRLLNTKVKFVADTLKEQYGDYYPAQNNYDFRSEGNELIHFLGDLETFLNYNDININLKNVEPTRNETIEFIVQYSEPEVAPRNFSLLDIRYTFQDGKQEFLRISWPESEKAISWNRLATISLLYWTSEALFDMFNSNAYPPWADFIETYIYPPRSTSGIGAGLMDDIPFSAEDIANLQGKIGEVMGWVDYGVDVLQGKQSLLPLADQYIKSAAGKAFEDNEILSNAFQNAQAQRTNKVWRNTDASITNNARFLSQITSPEDLYRQLINHVDLRYIVAKIALCTGLGGFGFEYGIDDELLELILALIALLTYLASMDLTTIDFSDFKMPTFADITEDLVNMVLNYLISLINSFIATMFAELLKQLDALCQQDFDQEPVDLSGLIADNFDNLEEADKFFDGLARALRPEPPEDCRGTLQELIADLSVLLTTGEICSMVQGTLSRETLKLMHGVILLDKYSCFHERFDTLEKVSDFFASLGGLIDPSLCEEITRIPDAGAFEELCRSPFNEEIRRNIHSAKKDITSEQVEELIAAERDRRQTLLEELADLASGKDSPAGRALDALQNSKIAQKIAEHPSTMDGIQQMIDNIFLSPAGTMINEGKGVLPTPYTIVNYEIEFPGPPPVKIPLTINFNSNKGIMNTISDPQQFKFYKFGKTTGDSSVSMSPNIEIGDGLIDHLSWINLNRRTEPASMSTIPTNGDSETGVTILEQGTTWAYRTNLSHKIGNWPNGKFTGPRKYNSYEIDWSDHHRARVASKWPTDLQLNLDSPMIKTFFIGRDPFVGIPPRDTSDEGVPIGLPVGTPLSTFPVEFDRSPFRELLRVNHHKYINKTNAGEIEVFNDLPKVFEENLIPNLGDEPAGSIGSKQQSTYVWLMSKMFGKFLDVHVAPADIRATISAVQTYWAAAMEPAKIAISYQCVFNDVMRILYRFVTDSEFHRGGQMGGVPRSEYMLRKLKEMFQDPNTVLELLGLTEDLETTIQEKISSKLEQQNVTSSGMITSAVGEPLLRFFIRIYIIEIYLKNMYMFVSKPSRRLSYGKKVVAMDPDFELDVSNPIFNGVLDIEDTIDPTMVSYIAEYIEYSSSRTISCDAFYGVAFNAVSEEYIAGDREILSVEGASGGDTLAHYPSLDISLEDKSSPKAAFKYIVAKELKAFLSHFQDFVKLSNFDPDGGSPSKVSLMKSFLDKFEIHGYNYESSQSNPARVTGMPEGLRMQFYHRYSNSGQVLIFDELRDSMRLSDDDKLGLRIILGASLFHPLDGYAHVFDISAQEFYEYASDALADQVVAEDGETINNPADHERAWHPNTGLPIVEYEETWGRIKERLGLTADLVSDNSTNSKKRQIVDHLKKKLIQTDDFRVMFEYVFPVRKMFNFMHMQMDQYVSAFLLNTKTRGDELEPLSTPAADGPFKQLEDLGITRHGILSAANIDPEQFINAKTAVKSILENVNNSDNYRYINEETSEAGGQGRRALKGQLGGD